MQQKNFRILPSAAGSRAIIADEDDEPPDSYHQLYALPLPDEPVILPFPRHRAQTSFTTSRTFRKRFYPGVTAKEWNSWQWQVGNRIKSATQLKTMLHLSSDELLALDRVGTQLPAGITPYYMSLLDPDNPGHALRRSVIPTVHEYIKSPGEADDPLGEEGQSPVHGLVHRYPDRALLLVHDFCSTYCRYCTRSRVVGHGALLADTARLEKALDYIRATPAIRDVILSGGDPLVLDDARLEWLLNRLRRIPHVEVIRIGTKTPAVLPQRITPNLVRMLKKYHPIWMSLHFTHPEECTPDASRACGMLADAGIPLGSQTVLLRGINDDIKIMKSLMQNLMKMRVRPYYLYQCDPISGSGHFRTPVEKGLEIIRGLRGFTSGYAVPTFVIDAPGGGGKIPLMPKYVIGKEDCDLVMINYKGGTYRYPEAV